ncbi:MAG: TOBE domain-containing protein, partial [Candidatus Atribacteria bacterium]|nr:TOBE domain-containing protein [Candidatus Atribacteria bacterium]
NNKFVAGFIGSPAMNFIDSKIVKENGDYFIDAESFKVKAPQAFYSKIADYAGKEVIFGVRPEDLHDKQFISQIKPSAFNTINTKAEVIEPLGAEIFIYLTCGKHSIIGKMDSRTQIEVDQNMEVVLDMEKTHIFDPKTLLVIV